ncbi:MAG TPA: hypothetical protein VET25_10465, partial [Aestuariivirgaceae bacterium]|nr:hypothetical protein [Aestuariivirgaceae bacterium]
ESAAADLRPLVDSCHELALSPRKLMALALKHLHPVTLAKLVNVPLCHDPLANRLFWRADEHTLLGHFFLLHMIALRPEVTNFSISAPCDYSFVPELCPSGNVVVMTDSDESLIVEMQPRRHEMLRLRPGPFDIAALGRSLMDWTTAQHRANARHSLTFHAGELPSAAGVVAAEAGDFVADLERHLLTPPKSHCDQPYWASAIAEWSDAVSGGPRLKRQAGRRQVLASSSWRAALFGRVPDLRPWHPRWPDFRQLRSLLQAHFPKNERLLIVANSGRFASWVAEAGWVVETRELASCFPAQTVPASSTPRFAGALLLIDPEAADGLASAVPEIGKLVRHGGALILMVTNGLLEDTPRPLSADWLSAVCSLVASGPRIEKCDAVYRRRLGTGLQDTFVNLLRASYHAPMRQVLSVTLGVLLLPASLISNLLTVRRRTLPSSGFWSSLMIVMRSGVHPVLQHGQRTAGDDLTASSSDCSARVSMQPPKLPTENIGGVR